MSILICLYLLFSLSGHHTVSKNFLFTLGLGVTFGFSFAYMLLSATGAGRKEIFLGPPYHPDTRDNDPHDHKVRRQDDRMTSSLYKLTDKKDPPTGLPVSTFVGQVCSRAL